MRVKCLAQEHNTMSPARVRTPTARAGVERTNHEATAPPSNETNLARNCKILPFEFSNIVKDKKGKFDKRYCKP